VSRDILHIKKIRGISFLPFNKYIIYALD